MKKKLNLNLNAKKVKLAAKTKNDELLSKEAEPTMSSDGDDDENDDGINSLTLNEFKTGVAVSKMWQIPDQNKNESDSVTMSKSIRIPPDQYPAPSNPEEEKNGAESVNSSGADTAELSEYQTGISSAKSVAVSYTHLTLPTKA